MKNEIKEILDYLKESAIKQNLYFEINPEKAKRLLDYITNLQEEKDKEIDRLNNIISETSKDIQHELSHLKANDEVSWNEEFYTNNKLDYRKLCIALLEQVVNKLKEKE